MSDTSYLLIRRTTNAAQRVRKKHAIWIICSIGRNLAGNFRFHRHLHCPESAQGQNLSNSLTMKALLVQPHLSLIWSEPLYINEERAKSREAGWRMMKKHHQAPNEHTHQHRKAKVQPRNTITNVRKLRI